MIRQICPLPCPFDVFSGNLPADCLSISKETNTMLELTFLLTVGFTTGLYYSRGKADPVASAARDAARLVGKATRAAGRAIRAIKETKP
jgi:hypothetical protein